MDTGFPFHVTNRCDHPVRIAIRFEDSGGRWLGLLTGRVDLSGPAAIAATIAPGFLNLLGGSSGTNPAR